MSAAIRLLNNEEYVSSKALWDKCFPQDGLAFIDWYYRARSRPEYVIGAFEDERIVSMLHMIPMDIKLDKAVHKVCFVSGVCTDPDYRERGLCTLLFRNAFPIMRQRGFHASMLQPFDAGFYSQYGYKTVIRHNRITLSDYTIGAYSQTGEQAPTPRLLEHLYSEFIRNYSGFSMRNESYFNEMINEYKIPDGSLICNARGYCAGYMEDGRFIATELVMPMTAGKTVDISMLASLLPKHCDSASVPLPCDVLPPMDCQSNIEDFSMLALLDAAYVQRYGHRSVCVENDSALCDVFGNVTYGFDRY